MRTNLEYPPIYGHLSRDGGEIKLFGRDYTDAGMRVRVGALIKNAEAFPNSSVYQNFRMQTINLGLQNLDDEIRSVLKIILMEYPANIEFKSCSFSMKQRIGIAMALLGTPARSRQGDQWFGCRQYENHA